LAISFAKLPIFSGQAGHPHGLSFAILHFVLSFAFRAAL
jgi:hypothetical protein